LLGSCFSPPSSDPATPSELLEKAVFSEETEGDLDAALQHYQQVVEQGKDTPAAAGQAPVPPPIKDNGVDLFPHDAKGVFKRFYQVEQRMSRMDSECGLGLSIVKFIVTAHDVMREWKATLAKGAFSRSRIGAWIAASRRCAAKLKKTHATRFSPNHPGHWVSVRNRR